MKQSSHRSVRLRRGVASFVVTASMVAATSALGAGTAHADQVYLPCPMPVAGAVCGFEGTVSQGPVTVIFRYATAQGYGEMKKEHHCGNATCWIGQHAVGDPGRTPAGFDVRARGAFISWREYS